MHFRPPITLENTIEWYHKNQKKEDRADMIFEDDNGNKLAMGGLTFINHEIGKAEFYIFVNPSLHGSGIGTEATKLLCLYGFKILNLQKIYLFANSDNEAANHLYEKVGFKREGILRDELRKEGKFLDRYYYGLLATDFNCKDLKLEFSY